MNEEGWDILVTRWVIVLIIIGVGNELVRQLGTIHGWFVFQLSKTLLLLIFASYQLTLTKKYRTENNTNNWGIRVN